MAKLARIDKIQEIKDEADNQKPQLAPIDKIQEIEEPQAPQAPTVTAPPPQPSPSQSALAGLEAARPAPYESNYQGQIDSLLNSILNREKFNYDMNADPLYQQYKDQYVAGGRRAMMDTMGQAAALTGGYGNSYASTAGNQAYQQYLTGLNDKALDLYDRVYGRYQDEGNTMLNNLSALMGVDNTAYSRHRDSYGDWLTDRDYYYGKTQDELAQQNWADQFAYQQSQDAQQQQNWQMEYDYTTRKWKKKKKSGSGTGSSSGGGGSGGGSGSGSAGSSAVDEDELNAWNRRRL